MPENLSQYGFRYLTSGNDLTASERETLRQVVEKGLSGIHFLATETRRLGIISVAFNPEKLDRNVQIGLSTLQTIYNDYQQRYPSDVAYTTFLQERAPLLRKFKEMNGFNFFDGPTRAERLFNAFQGEKIDPSGWVPFPLILV